MTQSNLPRIVCDTNALVSAAILPGSVSRQALLYAVENFQLVHSEETWAELDEVIGRKKFDRYFPNVKRKLVRKQTRGYGDAECTKGF